MNHNQHRRSIIAGGLTSSAGILISKAIGILYVSPFTALATQPNTAYYSYGYTLYDLALQIAVAGIPLAIASLIAKYYVKDDIATVLMIRKLARNLLFFIGLVTMMFIIMFATPLARLIVTENVSIESIERTRNVLYIIGVAMLVTPVLGSYRSLFQGLKYMEIYAFSQVLEQLVRVGFMLGIGYVLVVVLGLDSMWAVYAAVTGAVIAGVMAIVHLSVKDRRLVAQLKQEAGELQKSAIPVSDILKEVLYFSIPYVIISFLGNSFSVVNLFLFNRVMFMIIDGEEQVKLLFTMIMFTTSKLTSIPQVLALGFSAAVIPYISEAIMIADRRLIKKNIYDAIETVLYFAMPLSAGLFFFAFPIYYLFYFENAMLGGEVLRYAAFGGVFLALSPVVTTIMLTVRLRRQVIWVLALGFLIKLISMYPLMLWIGYGGAILSTYLSSLVIISVNLYLLSKQYGLRYRGILRRLLFMFLGIMVSGIVYYASIWMGVPYLEVPRWITLLYLALFGGLSMFVYFAITWLFLIPQTIFNVRHPMDIIRKR